MLITMFIIFIKINLPTLIIENIYIYISFNIIYPLAKKGVLFFLMRLQSQLLVISQLSSLILVK